MKKLILVLFMIILVCSGCSSSINDKEYYFKQMNLKHLWEYSKGESQTIAFIDTGISNEVKELYQNRIIDTYNSIKYNNNVVDKHGHGTQMISIAAGSGEKDIWGIAPKSKIIVIKAIGEEGQENPASILKAIDYAISKKVDIINMSFGSFVSNSEIKNKIKLALTNNITVVASTGDYGNKDSLFPANMEGVVSVQAKDENGSKWQYSNTSKNDVAAFPGVEINSLTLDNKKVKMDGTSEATAIASGYIALLRDYYTENNINFNNNKIIKDLKSLQLTQKKKVNYIRLFKK
ncbi:S8 family serine peptidase [Neobacillus niacini]|uniref:S8 family peptidase n=1 Tax=Neobacillus niacini TaxID=86668 RepID=UPI0028622A8F|nr:S8 family serine peptidase [Neobacillus niacini]MDR7002446.1 subtilisin family serine protease [Neobacillus niacini]